MVTADVIPETDILTQWNVVGGTGTHESAIDEDKGSPNTSDYIQADMNMDNVTDSFHMTTIAGIEEYTQIVVYLYLINIVGEGTPRQVNIWVNGGWLTAQNIPSQGSAAWKNFTWASLSGNQASLDDLRVLVKTQDMVDGKYVDDLISVYTMYATITYTEAPVGYGHDFLGIPAANIDSIMGIPTANIDNICGL